MQSTTLTGRSAATPAPGHESALAAAFRPPVRLSVGPELRALVVDESVLSRSITQSMLRNFGVQHVVQAARPEEVRRIVAGAVLPFDIVVCEFHFSKKGNVAITGQDVLDELRQCSGIPLSTAFVMVTDEARYQHVADSIEGALDDYLIKPFSTVTFEDRLRVVLDRKRVLKPVFDRIEQGDYAGAAERCDQLFAQGDKYRLYAARIGTDLYLRLGQHVDAARLFSEVLKLKAIPWARLGLARVELELAGPAKACRALESLVTEKPDYADAYDVLARAQMDEVRLEDALTTFTTAVTLTPANITRLQKLGALETFLGKDEAARLHLDSAVNLGHSSRALDFQTHFNLSLANYDLNVTRGWERSKRLLEQALEKTGGSYRVGLLLNFVECIELLSRKRIGELLVKIRAIGADIRAPEFDFEMAANLYQLLSRLEATEVTLEESTGWATTLAERFCVSRMSARLLELAAGKAPRLQALVKEGSDRIAALSQTAMAHAVGKRYEESAVHLIEAGEATLNGKLFALAKASLTRHRDKLDATRFEQLNASLAKLHSTYAAYGTHASAEIRLRTVAKK